MNTHARSPPAAASVALISMAVRNPRANAVGSRYAVPVNPARPGITAIASRPAPREMALLTPEAIPAYRVAAAASTVAVSGATVSVSPRPNTNTAGSTGPKGGCPFHPAHKHQDGNPAQLTR